MGEQIFAGYSEHFNEEARLVIIRTLSEQSDYRLNDSLLVQVLNGYGFNRGRDYVRAQLEWLETSAGAVTTRIMGSAIVAEITEAGLEHVGRARRLPGIKPMSPSRR